MYIQIALPFQMLDCRLRSFSVGIFPGPFQTPFKFLTGEVGSRGQGDAGRHLKRKHPIQMALEGLQSTCCLGHGEDSKQVLSMSPALRMSLFLHLS